MNETDEPGLQLRFTNQMNDLEWHGLHISGTVVDSNVKNKMLPPFERWKRKLRDKLWTTSTGVKTAASAMAEHEWLKFGFRSGMNFLAYTQLTIRLYEVVAEAVTFPTTITTVEDFYDQLSSGLNSLYFQLTIVKADQIRGLECFENLYIFYSIKIKVHKPSESFIGYDTKNIRLRTKIDDIHSTESEPFWDWDAKLTVANGSLEEFKTKTLEELKILDRAAHAKNSKDEKKKLKRRAKIWARKVRLQHYLRFVRPKRE